MTQLEEYQYLFTHRDIKILEYLAEHNYIWWETYENAINKHPFRLIASAMCLANSLQSFNVLIQLNSKIFKHVLKNAQPGWFNPKNWYFWHYFVYGSIKVPPIPVRFKDYAPDYRLFKG
ncbi:hypothetical protein [Helicobacter suis]|uniref:Uncharacterized protein n=1 Tax=Helicobacter suis TaxID=104628 RepID=A0A6J4CXE4_9HELI|nr:hypothetical protein [Helicobacter suis]BCD45687.1 hypothetical protein NHP190020_07260 [Helicobacter suis]BCD48385.1 hypothetical protein NHP194003_15890 [Helicobacter suis]BCD50162.1 hypothetical protein NHP194004_16090 [Helicobacter suis]BCD51910.1 hypothetical protein NHP194022_15810 [Helicobacter suis]BCD70156.1 hypothetical protein SNTW_08010 [Helicobacter suis]